MPAFHVEYTVVGNPKRSRLTNFFRGYMCLPLYIVWFFWAIGIFFVYLVAWFALLFTARYPEGLYAIMARFVRFTSRVSSYRRHLTDVYPPFNGEDDQNYPVRIQIQPPLQRYNRLLVLVNYYYVIPLLICDLGVAIWRGLCSIASWWVILFTGTEPDGLQAQIANATRFLTRAQATQLIMTQKYPFGPTQVPASPTGSQPPESPGGGVSGPLSPAH